MGQNPICGFTSKTDISKVYSIFLWLGSLTIIGLENLALLWYFLLKKGNQTSQFNCMLSLLLKTLSPFLQVQCRFFSYFYYLLFKGSLIYCVIWYFQLLWLTFSVLSLKFSSHSLNMLIFFKGTKFHGSFTWKGNWQNFLRPDIWLIN